MHDTEHAGCDKVDNAHYQTCVTWHVCTQPVHVTISLRPNSKYWNEHNLSRWIRSDTALIYNVQAYREYLLTLRRAQETGIGYSAPNSVVKLLHQVIRPGASYWRHTYTICYLVKIKDHLRSTWVNLKKTCKHNIFPNRRSWDRAYYEVSSAEKRVEVSKSRVFVF